MGKLNSIINEATYPNIDYKKEIKNLTKYMLENGENIIPLPKIIFKHNDTNNAKQFLGKTAYYEPQSMSIILYTEGRHPKDIVRSFAHEMIHHIQNLEGRLGNITTTNTQEDDHLNNLEAEANLKGTMTFRNWTDKRQERKNKDPFGLTAYALELARGLEETLHEAKQASVLYHYTLHDYLINIIQDNTLLARSITAKDDSNKSVKAISLTRDSKFESKPRKIMGTDSRIVLDGGKLSTKYKISPYAEPEYRTPETSESEERIIFLKDSSEGIPNLDKYVISYDINVDKGEYIEDIIDLYNLILDKNYNISYSSSLPSSASGTPYVRFFKNGKVMSKEELEKFIKENEGSDLLNENTSPKEVYHFTLPKFFVNMVKTNTIKADPKFKQISFTTDPDLWSFREFPDEDQEVGVRLTFDTKNLPPLKPFVYSGAPGDDYSYEQEYVSTVGDLRPSNILNIIKDITADDYWKEYLQDNLPEEIFNKINFI